MDADKLIIKEKLEDPMKEEVKRLIIRSYDRKIAGTNGINLDLIKYGGEELRG